MDAISDKVVARVRGAVSWSAGPEVVRVKGPACPRCDRSLRGLPLAGGCPGCGAGYDSEVSYVETRVRWRWRHVVGRLAAVGAMSAGVAWMALAVMGAGVGAAQVMAIGMVMLGGVAMLSVPTAALVGAMLEPGWPVMWRRAGGMETRSLPPFVFAAGGVIATGALTMAVMVGAVLWGM